MWTLVCDDRGNRKMNPRCCYCKKEMKRVESTVSFLGHEHKGGYICMGTIGDIHYHWKRDEE